MADDDTPSNERVRLMIAAARRSRVRVDRLRNGALRLSVPGIDVITTDIASLGLDTINRLATFAAGHRKR